MLSDIKVLELASVLAGPSVGQFFVELGAEVINIENPSTRGDVTRTWKLSSEPEGDVSAYFSSVNWGKKSISIDVSKEEGRQLVYKLAEDVDIIIASYKPGDAQKLQMDYEVFRQINPKIVYGKITGYGDDDPRVGYDAVIQAESGFMFMNGEPGGNSLKMPVALIDVLAAHHLKEGILVALLNRTKSGLGECVSVSLMEAAISSLANQATNYLVGGVIPQKTGSQHPNIAPYGDIFTTKDDKQLLLAVGNDKQFGQLCEVLDCVELTKSTAFNTNSDRVKNRQLLNQKLAVAMSKMPAKELIINLNKMKVPCAEIMDMRSVFETSQAKSVLIHSENLPQSMKGIRNFVANFSKDENSSHFLPPPVFGQHTEEVLMSKIGLNASKINELKLKGVI